jgi:IS30 family transposase
LYNEVELIRGKESSSINDELLKITKSFPDGVFKSITSDNGSEFSQLDQFGKEHGIAIYFAHPYSSWERGTNENHNKLIRRFIAKGVDIGIYSEAKIKKIETWCNKLSRKKLDYSTPEELFKQELEILG